jgi:Site-specific recombinase XerD
MEKVGLGRTVINSAKEKYWCVTWREIGKDRRRRKFFKLREEAAAFREQKRLEQLYFGAATSFTETERLEYRQCTERLKPFGKTILNAVEHYVAHLEATQKSRSVAQLVREVIAAKKIACGRRGLPASKRYIEDLESRLSRFEKDFDGKPIATITDVDLEDWLVSLNLSPVSRSNYARALGVAFSFAVKRKYVSSNPVKGVGKPTGEDSEPGVLTVDQATRLLAAATGTELLAYVAIGLFGGLRRSEIERLDWTAISFEENHIAVKKSKTGKPRYVEMLPNLRDWLLPIRKLSRPVAPQEDFRKGFGLVRERAGIDEWPSNALRHSYASYYLAHFCDDRKLKLEMGHWRDSNVLFDHYRKAVTKREAERFWNIRPTTTENVIPLAAAS